MQQNLSQLFYDEISSDILARGKQEKMTCESESVTIFYRNATCNKVRSHCKLQMKLLLLVFATSFWDRHEKFVNSCRGKG
jgi:hypothetical protein